MNRGQQLTLIGSIGLLVGAFLPWVSIASLLGRITKAGYEGDGIITGGIGLLILVGSLLNKGKPGKRYSTASSIFAFIAGIIGVWDLINVNSAVADIAGEALMLASTGSGLYLTIIGSILSFVGGLQIIPELAVSNPE